MRLSIITLVGVVGWWALGAVTAASVSNDKGEPPRTSEPPRAMLAGIRPQEDKEINKLIFEARHPGYNHKKTLPKAVQAIQQMPAERVLGAIAAGLTDPEHGVRSYCLEFIVESKDRRLVLLVAAVMPQCKDRQLLLAAQAANAMPDRRFVRPLIEYALDKDYVKTSRGSPWWRGGSVIASLFAEVTQALEAITAGEAGIRAVSKNVEKEPDKGKAKKDEIRARWKTWWQANQKTWEAQTVPEEKPEEVEGPVSQPPEEEPE